MAMVADGEDDDDPDIVTKALDTPTMVPILSQINHHLAANKRQKHKHGKWPPWKDDLEDEDDLDGMQGCEYCVDKPVSPQRAWNAFYKDSYSLRNSWCIGKRCEDPAWAEEARRLWTGRTMRKLRRMS